MNPADRARLRELHAGHVAGNCVINEQLGLCEFHIQANLQTTALLDALDAAERELAECKVRIIELERPDSLNTAIVEAARADERERCVEVVTEWVDPVSAKHIATAIRAGRAVPGSGA